MRKLIVLLSFWFCTSSGIAQISDSIQLGFTEYIAMVKKHHPLVKQANLILDEAEVKLLKARGNFDPKIEADYGTKNYKSTEYYNKFNSAFKIPTWYGLELNAKFEDNSGAYLNPQNTVPENGLYSAGVALNVTDGIFMSERMAALKKAKIYREQSQFKRQLQVTEILYKASVAYFDWYAAYQQYKMYQNFLENAENRFDGISKSYAAGDKPAIDTLEAGLSIQNRRLELQQSLLEMKNSKLNLSNFIWTQGNIPLELEDEVIPLNNISNQVSQSLKTEEIFFELNLDTHPKVQSLNYELDMLDVERRLKANKLLPDLDLEYNFLTNTAEEFNTLNNRDYKFGLKFSLPIFLRKERGELKLAKLELQNTELDLISTRLSIENKIKSLQNQISGLREQNVMMEMLVRDYDRMVQAEERKFELGESSLFLINSRETKLISARLKEINMTYKLLKSQAEFYRVLAEVTDI